MDYTYLFDPLTEMPARVRVIDQHVREQYALQVAVDDHQLLLKTHRMMPAEIADLVDVAVMVYVADRLSIRQADMPCCIHSILPVRHPEVLGRSPVVERLQDVLFWYTGDHWSFEFTLRTVHGRSAEVQMCLPITDPVQPVKVALWSGGLDSLAGLYNQLVAEPITKYTLLGTGANTLIYSIQQRIAEAVGKQFHNRTKLVQVPYHLLESKDVAKSSSQRSRGFVFLLIGAACAYLEGQHTVYIYENGIGAINLPFRESEVGLDHSRSVHPLSLLHMSNLVSQLLGRPFTFENPFLFWTKAQMCAILAQRNALDLIFLTITCDRLHREQPMQCGCCSSCLLRRQALAVLGIEDQTPYIVTAAHSDDRARGLSHSNHLRAMLSQVNSLRFRLNAVDPWRSLSKQYVILQEIVDQGARQEGITRAVMVERLLQCYSCYVHEWESVQHIIGQGLLEEEMQLPA